MLKDDEIVGKTSTDIQEHDTVQPSEPDEDKKADKDIEIDQDEKDYTTSKDHETVQNEETVKDNETEKDKEDIEMFVCKKSAEEIQSIDNNDREEADGISNSRKTLNTLKTNKEEHNLTETKEMLPQRREVILQIDEVCKSNHVVGLKRENSGKEATKQLLEHDLIAEEDNVVIEMGTDNDGIVSILKTQFSKSIKFFLVLDSKTAKAILHLIFLKITN